MNIYQPKKEIRRLYPDTKLTDTLLTILTGFFCLYVLGHLIYFVLRRI
jgi:hypothetical protein